MYTPNFSSSSGSLSDPEGLFIIGLLIKAIKHTASCLSVTLSLDTCQAMHSSDGCSKTNAAERKKRDAAYDSIEGACGIIVDYDAWCFC
jgi:hypothetical protein